MNDTEVGLLALQTLLAFLVGVVGGRLVWEVRENFFPDGWRGNVAGLALGLVAAALLWYLGTLIHLWPAPW